jgi:hypothetical protein
MTFRALLGLEERRIRPVLLLLLLLLLLLISRDNRPVTSGALVIRIIFG